MIHHEAFPQVIAFLEESAEVLRQLLGLCGLDRTIQEGSSVLRETTENCFVD